MSDAVVDHGRASIEQGSTSFAAASKLFGRTLREDVWRLYAWCRYCDDLIDGQDHGGRSQMLSAEERKARLADLRAKTALALTGAPMEEPAFAAFQAVALRHAIDPRWPHALLDGFALDVEPRGFADQSAVLTYCWGVAGAVGVMMAAIMGVRDKAVLQRAQDLGLAFQLTNISRDVFEDAANGRVYLPADALAAVGVAPSPAALLDAQNRALLFEVVRDQLALAEAYYDSARVGLRDLPYRGALAVAAARRIYRRIGRKILKRGPASLATRTKVARPMMLGLLLLGAFDAVWSRLERLKAAPARPSLWSWL